jgi:His-Xaa-Ser system protein HxsD
MKKAAVRARAKPARRRAAPRVSSKPASGSPFDVIAELDPRKTGLEPILGAAYLMIDRAYVLVEGDAKKALKITLRPKAARTAEARAALAVDFGAELEAQRVRWQIARNNQSIREYVAENSLTLAQEFASRPAPGAAPAAEQLTSDQRAEIERLIAEVETEIKAMNEQKAHPDPKGAAQSWEAGRPQGGETPA